MRKDQTLSWAGAVRAVANPPVGYRALDAILLRPLWIRIQVSEAIWVILMGGKSVNEYRIHTF